MTYGKSKRTAAPLDDPQLNTDFTYNLDSCVVQGSREDRDTTPTGQGVVERVWITSRPPRLSPGVEPTVTARRTYVMAVMLTHVQGQMIDYGETICKKVCTGGKEVSVNTATAANPNKQASSSPRGQQCD
ncbi:unnamed protein product [Macrosiphum euphorbiae]|uniref:Uncharacterized protein n=1 Tax=Macrosiphum euphorbiae TaxID=13131 RepID=A0AAV0Y7U0_9HEMI|nr:unnamed protein product [Macrosiphum euphorbiae]